MSVGSWCERELAQEAKQGDREAFITLIRIHSGGILHYLQSTWRTTGSPEDADDLLQETFVQAWKNKEMFQERGSEGASSFADWLFGIARNVFKASYRKRKKKLEREEPLSEYKGQSSAPLPYEDMESCEADAILRDCINKLASPYREVMELYITDDYTIAEIAHMLGRRRDAIRQQKYRGTKMLKELIRKDSRGQAYFKTIGK